MLACTQLCCWVTPYILYTVSGVTKVSAVASCCRLLPQTATLTAIATADSVSSATALVPAVALVGCSGIAPVAPLTATLQPVNQQEINKCCKYCIIPACRIHFIHFIWGNLKEIYKWYKTYNLLSITWLLFISISICYKATLCFAFRNTYTNK